MHSEGQNYDVKEVDASTINNAESMKLLLKHISLPPSSSRYKVFIVDGCHALTSEAWKALLKAMEEPPSYAVFILITTDLEPLPRSAVSQCRRLMFPRIKDADIVFKLQTIAMQENVEIELEAVQFIASRSDGSFRDAENMLDQLSLLGIKVTLATVQEMVISSILL
jgi:DNA polymerase III subunit gamma/tau